MTSTNAITKVTGAEAAALFVIKLNGLECQAMLDSGCSADSIVTQEFASRHQLIIRKATADVRLADKSVSSVQAFTDLTISLGGEEYELKDVQVWKSCVSDFILGLGS